MDRLSMKKKLAVVKQYLGGLSYDQIAAKSGISKGSVANIIVGLKAGMLPEVADVSEDIDLLRELSHDLKQQNLTPVQCATGLIALNRINECGLDPADIDRWPVILKSAGAEDNAQEFVQLVYSIQEVQQRTGLGLEALDNKTHELEKKISELEPMLEKLEECKKEIAEHTRQREELTGVVAGLKEKYALLKPIVRDLERRQQTMSRRMTDMEPKAQKAEATLSTLESEIQKLDDTGLSLKGLAEFNEKLQMVAQHHDVEPVKLRGRLLHELETLDKGLGLETLIQSRQQELEGIEKDIIRAKREMATTGAAMNSLKQEKASLEAGIKETRDKVSREIVKIIPIAQDTISRLGEDLRRGNEEALAEIRSLKDEAVEVGKDIGQYEGILKANAWLGDLPALVRGEDGIAGKQVRAITLAVVRGAAIWLKGQDNYLLSVTIDRLIGELEEWEV